MSFVLFDIGANWGTDSLDVTRDNAEYLTYAFEPTPELQSALLEKSADFSDRYHVIGYAVSDFDGEADFNIASHADWGVSSLLEFAPDIKRTWGDRQDLYVDRVETVPVTRLDSWFRRTRPPITQIDFFHCDTQGSDLKVLAGMGEFLPLIRDGVIECPQSDAVRLYEGQHSMQEAYDFLEANGFFVYRTESQQNEVNLYFKRNA